MLKDGATPWEKEGRATIFQDQDETIAQGSIGWMPAGIQSKEANSCSVLQLTVGLNASQ